MDILAAAGAAFTSVLTARVKGLAEWLMSNMIAFGVLAIGFGSLVAATAQNDDSFLLDPVAGVEQLMVIAGIEDPVWLHNAVAWLQRPELQVAAGITAAIAGVVALLRSRHSAEIAWLLLVPAVVALGSSAGFLALAGLGGAVLFLTIGTIIAIAAGEQNGRLWFGVPSVFERAITAAIEWVLTPLAPILRLGNALIDTVSAEDRRELAIGAVPISRMEPPQRPAA